MGVKKKKKPANKKLYQLLSLSILLLAASKSIDKVSPARKQSANS